LIVFDASTLVGAALKADSVPERALLRAEEIDVLALSAAVDAELSEALSRPKLQGLTPSAARIRVTRASERKAKVDRSSGVIRESLKAGPGKVDFMRYVVPAGAQAGPFPAHRAGTIEHVHLEAGRIKFVLGSEAVTLSAGDGCSCHADSVHSFDNRRGKAKARLYVVIEVP
jgi:quercetin dioxygenase-like cupin family protein